MLRKSTFVAVLVAAFFLVPADSPGLNVCCGECFEIYEPQPSCCWDPESPPCPWQIIELCWVPEWQSRCSCLVWGQGFQCHQYSTYNCFTGSDCSVMVT